MSACSHVLSTVWGCFPSSCTPTSPRAPQVTGEPGHPSGAGTEGPVHSQGCDRCSGVPWSTSPASAALCPLQSLARWESENKMVCEQRLLKGDGPKTGWSREMTNDGELILVRRNSGLWGQRCLQCALGDPHGGRWDGEGATAVPVTLLLLADHDGRRRCVHQGLHSGVTPPSADTPPPAPAAPNSPVPHPVSPQSHALIPRPRGGCCISPRGSISQTPFFFGGHTHTHPTAFPPPAGRVSPGAAESPVLAPLCRGPSARGLARCRGAAGGNAAPPCPFGLLSAALASGCCWFPQPPALPRDPSPVFICEYCTRREHQTPSAWGSARSQPPQGPTSLCHLSPFSINDL